MNRNTIEEKFLDLIEGTLSEAESAELHDAIAADPELSKSFKEYQALMKLESTISQEARTPPAGLVNNVMEQIDREVARSASSILLMRLSMLSKMVSKRSAVAALSLVAVVSISTQLYRTESLSTIYTGALPSTTAATCNNCKIKDGMVLPQVDHSKTEALKGNKVSGAELLDHNPADNQHTDLLDQAPAMEEFVAKDKEKVDELKKRVEQDAVTNMPSIQIPVPRERELFNFGRSQKALAVPGGLAAGGEGTLFIPAPATSTEQYNNVVENQRILVSQEATSTFSIDVDTASYSNARRFLQMGQLPPSESVRIEEFINYFDYNYPRQHEAPFAAHYELAPSPLEPDRVFLKLGVRAKDAVQSDKGWNLVFLIDTSGSMSDANKLPLVKQSLTMLADKMRANDKVAIVTYAGSAGTLLEPTSGADKSKIIAAIEQLGAGGSTNGSGGITAAYEAAEKMKVAGAVNRVVLATDGDFNVGVTSQDALIKLIEDKRKGGITLTALGFGTGNIHDGTMEQLADKGNGNYFYIDSFKEARKVLETDLAGNMEVVAKDVKLQIEFNPAKVSSYRLVGYENRKLANEDFKNDKVDAGEIGSGHTVTAIYELVLKGSELEKNLKSESRYQPAKEVTVTPNDSSEIGFLKIRFKAPEGETSQELSFPIESNALKKSAAEASTDFRFAAAVAYFAQLLHESKFVGTYTFADIAKLAEGNLGEDKIGYRREFVELVNNARALKR